MIPIQFILLLLIATMPGEIDTSMVGASRNNTVGSIPWTLAIIVSFLVWHGCVALFVWMRTRRLIRDLHEPSVSTTSITLRTSALFNRARWLTLLITGAHLSSSLPWTVLGWL